MPAATLNWSDTCRDRDCFVRDYWQQASLFLRGGLEFRPPLDLNEIAGLACEPDIESQLIRTHREHDGGLRYESLDGPFDPAFLAALPARDWTLLVHDVEKHLPDLRPLLGTFDVAPDWRIDDLMISLAAPGGSVGAHSDSYDVFLLQGEGQREWSLAPAGSGSADLHSTLHLQHNAQFDRHYSAECGDILYLPPGIIHHGVANDWCSTWSIGMQAPLLSDIAALCDGTLAANIDRDAARYCDQHTAGTPPLAGEIPASVIHDLPITNAGDEQQLCAFGALVTQCKAGLRPPVPVVAPTNPLSDLPVHGYARLAYTRFNDELIVFANGQWQAFNDEHATNVVRLCQTRKWTGSECRDDLFRWLYGVGAFDI